MQNLRRACGSEGPWTLVFLRFLVCQPLPRPVNDVHMSMVCCKLQQDFSIRGYIPPRGHLPMSRDSFDCPNWGVARCYWHLVGIGCSAAYNEQMVPQNNDMTQNVHGAKTEKPWDIARDMLLQNTKLRINQFDPYGSKYSLWGIFINSPPSRWM